MTVSSIGVKPHVYYSLLANSFRNFTANLDGRVSFSHGYSLAVSIYLSNLKELISTFTCYCFGTNRPFPLSMVTARDGIPIFSFSVTDAKSHFSPFLLTLTLNILLITIYLPASVTCTRFPFTTWSWCHPMLFPFPFYFVTLFVLSYQLHPIFCYLSYHPCQFGITYCCCCNLIYFFPIFCSSLLKLTPIFCRSNKCCSSWNTIFCNK